LAIGFEENKDEDINKILYLDPRYHAPQNIYWNVAIQLNKGKSGYKNYYITPNGKVYATQFDDFLSITKKYNQSNKFIFEQLVATFQYAFFRSIL
jgi:hypothetical protein